MGDVGPSHLIQRQKSDHHHRLRVNYLPVGFTLDAFGPVSSSNDQCLALMDAHWDVLHYI